MNVYSGSARSAKIGLMAIVASWAASGLTVPIIKVLRPQFSAEELLFVRSLFSVTVSLAIARGKVWQSDWRMKAAGAIIGFSSIAFYRALQVWDVNPVMVIVAIIPAVNIAIAFLEGKRVKTIVVVSFSLLSLGVIRALDPWKQPINMPGLIWALASVVSCGIGFEMWGKAKEATVSEKCFWLSLALLIATPIIVACTQTPWHVEKYLDRRSLALIAVLGAMNGIVYINCGIIPFSKVGKMNTAVASVLLQVTTPCTIIGAYFWSGERLDGSQWLGVAIALSGAAILSVWTARQEHEHP